MNAAPILHGVIYQQSPTVVSGMEVMDSFSGQSLPVSNMGASANSSHVYIEIAAYIWVWE